jgi:chorismate lyase/3-hydroxybenzoate synthase
MNSILSPATTAAANLELEYLPSQQIAAQPAAWWQGVLGVVGFEKPPRIAAAAAPITASMTRALSGEELCEVWRVGDADIQLSNGDAARSRVQYRYCDDLLFGALTIDEHSIEARDEAGALLRATEIAYQEIFDVLEESNHRHLIRIWNYLPDINREAGGDERYRHFNSARQTAFRKSGRATMGTVPAACAVGSPTGSPISIYFLAGRRPPKMIENPRQTSAYHYPPKFGRHSPIFSRACVWGEPGMHKLFVSGTASIVGHETIHRGDVMAQTRETMVNIGALLDEANRLIGSPRYSAEALKLKVYVRHPTDLPAIKATLAHLPRPAAAVVFLQADVCREDLLVEIEAVG